jgi:hypothetical protein
MNKNLKFPICEKVIVSKLIFPCKLLNYVVVKSVSPPNDDINLSPPPANRTDVSSLPVFANPVALTLLVNVLDPLTV